MVFEPPCTERYARWCERSVGKLITYLLLDYSAVSALQSEHEKTAPPRGDAVQLTLCIFSNLPAAGRTAATAAAAAEASASSAAPTAAENQQQQDARKKAAK